MTLDPRIPDLFDPLRYPVDPGYRATDTSYDAALAMRPSKARLQQMVLDALADKPAGATSHELAYVTEQTYASIQPRTAELRIEGKIVDSGIRRKTPSGKNSIVWRLA